MKLVYLAPVPFRSYLQRPHYMVRDFVERYQYEVLWIDPYPTRLPRFTDLSQALRKKLETFAVEIQGVQPISCQFLPLEPLPILHNLNEGAIRKTQRRVEEFLDDTGAVLGIGKPSLLALRLLRAKRWKKRFFDAMDNYPHFYRGLSHYSMLRNEREVAGQVEHVFCSSRELQLRWANDGVKSELILNGYPMKDLAAPSGPAKESNIVGFIGTIGEWFDWELLVQLATQWSACVFELIGPVASEPPAQLPTNVKLLPACPQERVSDYLNRFSLGLIPFKKTPLTDGVDPIKFYEYMAYGLPVVTTSFGPMCSRIDSAQVFDADDVIRGKVSFEKIRDARPAVSEVLKFRANNDWAERFRVLHDTLNVRN